MTRNMVQIQVSELPILLVTSYNNESYSPTSLFRCVEYRMWVDSGILSGTSSEVVGVYCEVLRLLSIQIGLTDTRHVPSKT